MHTQRTGIGLQDLRHQHRKRLGDVGRLPRQKLEGQSAKTIDIAALIQLETQQQLR